MKAYFLILVLLVGSQVAKAYKPISDDRREELRRTFHYTPSVKVIRAVTAGCDGQDLEFNTNYPQRATDLKISGKSYIPVGRNFPVVFILPPLGGANQLDSAMAKTLCKSNVAAVILTTNLTGLDSPTLVPVTDHDHTHRRVASAIKGGMQALKNMPEINIEKVGLFGASLGGILGSVAYGVMPEISAGTFLVNGGDVPDILAHSDQDVVVKLKRQRMAEKGIKTDEEYEQFLNDHLELDPLHFVKYIDRDSTKLYLSRKDKSVPSVDQLAFYEAIGSPAETSFYSLGHGQTIFAVLGLGNQKDKITDWFIQRFALANPRQNQLP